MLKTPAQQTPRDRAGADDPSGLLQAILDGTPDAVFVKDTAGRYRLVNRAAANIAGLDAEDMVGRDDTAIFPPEVAQAIMAADRAVLASGEATTYEERVVLAGGEERIMLTTKGPLFGGNGAVDGVFGIARDITHSKRVEVAILEKLAMQDQLAKIAATVPGVICSFKQRPDGTYCFPYASAAVEDLYGFRPEELREDCSALLALTHPDDQEHVRDSIERSALVMAPWHAEFRYLHPHKGVRWIGGRSMPQRERDGSILWHGFVYDITERKRIESELIAAKQAAEATNASKSRFLAAASHDLRQPLQAASLFLNVLNRTALDDEQRKIGRNLTASVNALGELLDALLDISKLDAGFIRPQPASFDIAEVFARVDSEFAGLALERKLRFKLFFPHRAVAVKTDAKLLMGIVRNIVGNALRYTERGGILVGARVRPGWVALQIWDTGIGISGEYLAQIYDEFFQINNPHRDRAKGLGLGLSIVKRLVTLLGCEIGCRWRPGRGTVFDIRIPLDRASAGGRLVAAGARAADYSCLDGRHVVIVEDDDLVAKALEIWLVAHGMRVSIYVRAEDALAAAPDADLYISDFRLPGAIDGGELLDALQARSPRAVKGLLITGDTASEQTDALDAGRWPTLFKPVEPARLLAALVSLQRG